MTFIDRYVLLLNSTYEVIDVITWRRAIKLIIKEAVKVHEEFADGAIRTEKRHFPYPSVLVMNRFIGHMKNAKKIINLNKKNVLLRDNHTCMYCGKALTDSTGSIDHVVPLSRKGLNRWDNVVASCLKCNRKKDDQTPDEAGMKLLRAPFVPTRHIFFRKYLRKEEYSVWRNYIKGRDIA